MVPDPSEAHLATSDWAQALGLSYNLDSCMASAVTMVGLGVHNNPGGVVGTQACVLQWMVVCIVPVRPFGTCCKL